MAADNWEKKMRNMLVETDSNISSLKRNIAHKLSSTPSMIGASENVSHLFGRSSIYQTPKRHDYYSSVSAPMDRFAYQTTFAERRSSLVDSLSKKLEELDVKVFSLETSCTSLRYENKVQNEEIKMLKDEQKHFNKKFHGRGTEISTDDNFKRWQQDIRSELNGVQRLLKNHTQPHSIIGPQDVSMVSLTKEISEKALLRDEAEFLRRDNEKLKTSILKLENEVAMMTHDTKDLSSRHVRMERDVSSVNHESKAQSITLSRIEKEHEHVKREMHRLSNILEELHRENKMSESLKLGQVKSTTRKPLLRGSARYNSSITEQTVGLSDQKQTLQKRGSLDENSAAFSILSTELDLSLTSSLLLSDDDILFSDEYDQDI